MTEIVHFSNSWQLFTAAERLYESIEAELTRLLPWAEVHHIGSTAVPGSMTKGDLDVVVRVHATEFRRSEEFLAAHYARNEGSDRTDDFAAFMDDGTQPELGIQLVVSGSPSDVFNAWLEQLLNDPELRCDYDDLKMRYEGCDMEEYRAAKAAFIAERLVKSA
ncbi:MAG: GrpB family protein [Gammaproteobacteria bacterium]